MPDRAPIRAMTAGAMESPTMDATPHAQQQQPHSGVLDAEGLSDRRHAEAHVEMLRPLARKMAQIARCQRTSCERVSVECMPSL